ISTSMFFRLCSRAPRTAMIFCSAMFAPGQTASDIGDDARLSNRKMRTDSEHKNGLRDRAPVARTDAASFRRCRLPHFRTPSVNLALDRFGQFVEREGLGQKDRVRDARSA